MYQFDGNIISGSSPLIMGILNVTPDSFSDGGKFFRIESALEHARQMINAGADIIDIGGESTRPGSDFVSESEEINRVVPVIEQMLEEFPEAVLSIDTTKSKVAFEALKLGVRIVNDVSGLTFDPEILDVVRKFNASLVIMHIKGTPKNMQQNPVYEDVFKEVFEFLQKQVKIAEQSGVTKLIIDPGIGFGKSVFDNYTLLNQLSDFKSLGYPLLIGLSRKSFLGKSLGLNVENRDTATVIAETLALKNGADIIRTHNVENAILCRHIYKNLMNPELTKNNV